MGLNPSNAEVQEIINSVDSDGNGTIELSEFLEMMAVKMQTTYDTEEDIKQAFKVFDKDGSGTLTGTELRNFLTNFGEPLTEDEVNNFLFLADKDGNGQIDYSEFAKIMMRRK